MLACRACNRKVLAYARDNPETLRRAADMLERPPAIEAIGIRVAEPDKELWREVPGYGGWYEVSTLGRVRSYLTPARGNQHVGIVRGEKRSEPVLVSGILDGGRYMYVNLCQEDGSRRKEGIHRLVLLAFVGEPDGLQACHNNGVAVDNRLSNLRWDTALGNAADRALHGTNRIGETHNSAKLTDADVLWARSVYVKGSRETGSAALARRFGISQAAMHSALTGGTWTHLKADIPEVE
jgi:hypothetical protein